MNETVNAERLLEHAVAELLEERKQLLALFCELAGVDTAAASGMQQHRLQRFCQLLIDYASLWQFEIHDLLLKTQDNHAAARAMLEKQQPLILQASDAALEFNDRYDASKHLLDLSEVEAHLSRLGEILATRFDAEDRIISAL